jgi:NAD(P)-dependent dehydrogenase (short-subunit alcohol dehydrogenase family)
MPRLDAKVALVTGGTSGIGLAAAKALAKEGAHVYITGRREQELATAVQQIGGNATGVRGDVSNAGDLDRLYAQIKSEKQSLDSSLRMRGLPGTLYSETSLRNYSTPFSTSTSKGCCSQYRKRSR